MGQPGFLWVNLCQGLTVVTVKNIIVVCNLNVPSFSLKAFPHPIQRIFPAAEISHKLSSLGSAVGGLTAGTTA